MRVILALLAIFLAFSSCEKKRSRKGETITIVKVKKKKPKEPEFPFPKRFKYRVHGLRDPFLIPGETDNVTIGRIIGFVFDREENSFFFIMELPGGKKKVVRSGDKVGNFKIIGIKGDFLEVQEERIMPWGEKRVLTHKIPLSGGS